jgi:hypothetical protein
MTQQKVLTEQSKRNREALLQWALTIGALLMMVICTIGMLSLSGCGKKTLPPGALNQADFQSYDFLTTLKGSIDGFKTSYAAMTPAQQAQVKGPLNQAIKDYNLAEAAWQAEHAIGSGDLTNVNTLINNVLNDISALTTAIQQQQPSPTPVP